jgi:hypothetical protein
VIISDCIGGSDQLWTFKNSAVSAYDGTKCLAPSGGVNVNGVRLEISDCVSGNVNQQWYWTDDNHLVWTNHGRCMDLTEGSLANGNRIQIWDCNWYVDAFIGSPITDSRIPGPAVIKVRFCSSLVCRERLTFSDLLAWNVSDRSHTRHTGTGSSPTFMCQTLCTSALKPFNNALD